MTGDHAGRNNMQKYFEIRYANLFSHGVYKLEPLTIPASVCVIYIFYVTLQHNEDVIRIHQIKHIEQCDGKGLILGDIRLLFEIR
jgi:hypothetical protein